MSNGREEAATSVADEPKEEQASFDFGPTRPRVRAMLPSERRSVTEMLGRAFFDDPIAEYLFPRDEVRAQRFAGLCTLEIDSFAQGALVLTSDDLRGAAIWRVPGAGRPGPLASAWLALRMVGLMRGRTSRIASIGERFARYAPRERHYYLATLGTDPTAQGRGHGTALVHAVLDRCDRERLPAYLESSKASNLPFYQKFGFEVTSEIEIPDGPTVWGMLRPALAPQARER